MSSTEQQRWWHRLLKVVYTILLLFVLGIAISLCIALVWEDSNTDSSAFFYILTASIFGITIAFELIRRTVFYITSGKEFLSTHLPLHIKLLASVALLLLVSSGVVYMLVDIPRHAVEEQELAKQYAESKGRLATAEAALASCFDKRVAAKDAAAAETIRECEREKEIERGLYNDCRAGGALSHSFCISIHDYEAIKCEGMSAGSYAHFLYETACSSERNDVGLLKNFIAEYEQSH